MSTADLAPPLDLRPEPALAGAFALSFGMHLLLLMVLLMGVSWQTREPEPVVVELWRATPAPMPDVAQPVPPPVPAPEPEPVVRKPDIALKAAQKSKPAPSPVPKPEPRVERKPEPKPKPATKAPFAPQRDLAQEQRMKEQLAREHANISSQRQEEELRLLLARQQADNAAVRSKGLAAWTDKIRAKIKGNMSVTPPDLSGNPEAVYEVLLLPSGDTLSVKLRKSSGHSAWDAMVERAIIKSSPLPKPDDSRDFQRQLELKFRPQDK